MSNHSTPTDPADIPIDHFLDTQGLICPEPVMLLHRSIHRAEAGECIEVLATDPATQRDIPNFCRHLGHTLLLSEIQTLAPSDHISSDNTPNDNTDDKLADTLPTDNGNDSIDDSSHQAASRYRYLLQKKR